jgi:hypothetical protein
MLYLFCITQFKIKDGHGGPMQNAQDLVAKHLINIISTILEENCPRRHMPDRIRFNRAITKMSNLPCIEEGQEDIYKKDGAF